MESTTDSFRELLRHVNLSSFSESDFGRLTVAAAR
jgi:hypothetical protein